MARAASRAWMHPDEVRAAMRRIAMTAWFGDCGSVGDLVPRYGERDERGRGGRGRRPDARRLFAGGQSGRGLSEMGRTGWEARVRFSRRRPSIQRTEHDRAEVVLVNQRGLQFVPRVQAIALGQTVRFTNEDGETHNVHVVSPGFAFNQSMAPGQFQDFTPDQPGVMRLACDIHMHMRGFVVVSPTPWVQSLRSGRAVPARWCSRRPLHLDRLARDGRSGAHGITVAGGKSRGAARAGLDQFLGPARSPVGAIRRRRGAGAAVGRRDRPDQLTLAASRDAATRPGELAKARRLAEDAYWGEFEASDMETAVSKYLGFARAGELERQFHGDPRRRSRRGRETPVPRRTWPICATSCFSTWSSVTSELNAKGVTDRSRIDACRPDGSRSRLRDSGALPPRPGRPAIPERCSRRSSAGFRRVEQRGRAQRARRSRLRADHGLHDRIRAPGALPARPQPAGGPAAGNPVQHAPRRSDRGTQGREAVGAARGACPRRSRP